MQENKLTIRGELSLLLVIIINSLGVVLMLHSGSGISAISSVPYAFSLVFPTFKQTLCTGIPVQLRCRLGLQRHD